MRGILSVYVFVLVLALFPYTHDPADPIKRLATDGCVLLLAITWCLGSIRNRETLFRPTALSILVGAFFIVQLSAALQSRYPGASSVEVHRLLSLTLLFVFTRQSILRVEHAWALARVMVLAVAISSVYGLYQATGWHDPFPWGTQNIEEYFGLPSTYANPNFAAHALVIALILAVALLPRRPWFAIPALLMTLHLFGTHTRGAKVALCAAFVLVAATLWSRRRAPNAIGMATRAWLRTVLIGTMIITAGLLAHIIFKERLLPLDSSLLLRYNGYYGAANMILDHPISGSGPGVYAIESPAYWTSYEQEWYATTGKRNFHVHNDLLEAGVAAGLPGAFLYIALLVYAILRSLVLVSDESPGRRHLGLALAACFAAFIMDGLFGFNFHVPVSAGFLFLLMGLLDGLTRLAEGDQSGAFALLWNQVRNAGVPTPKSTLPLFPRYGVHSALFAVFLLAVAGGSCYFGFRSFRAEYAYQAAEGGRYYGEQASAQGKNDEAERCFQAAYNALDQAERLLPWDTRFPLYKSYLDLRRGHPRDVLPRLKYARSNRCADVAAIMRLARAETNIAIETWPAANGEWETAIEQAGTLLDRAAELCPVLPDLWELRARLAETRALRHGKNGVVDTADWQNSLDYLQRAASLSTGNRDELNRLIAIAAVYAQKPETAERAFAAVAVSHPEDTRLWDQFQAFAHETGRYSAYQDSLCRVIRPLLTQEPFPELPYANFVWRLSVAYREQNDLISAQRLVDEALDRTPAALPLWGEWFAVLDPATRFEIMASRAEKECAGLASQQRTAPEELGMLAQLAKPDAETLMTVMDRLRQRAFGVMFSTDSANVYLNMSWVADLAIAGLQHVALTPEQQAQFLASAGAVFVYAGRNEAALETLNAALPGLAGPPRGVAQAHLAEALARLKRLEDALAQAQEAAAAAPDDHFVRWMLARRLAEAGRAAEARTEYRVLLQRLSPNYPAYGRMAREFGELESRPEKGP